MSVSLLIIIIIASILSSLLYIILKYFEKFNVNNIHGLTANYVTASLFSFFFNYKANIQLFPHSSSYAGFAFGIGSSVARTLVGAFTPQQQQSSQIIEPVVQSTRSMGASATQDMSGQIDYLQCRKEGGDEETCKQYLN